MKDDQDISAVYIEDSYGDLTGAQIGRSGGVGLAIRGKSDVIFDRANISDNAGAGVDIRGGARFSGVDAKIDNNQNTESIYKQLGLSRSDIKTEHLVGLVRSAIIQKENSLPSQTIERALQACVVAVGLATEPVLAAIAIISYGAIHGLYALYNRLKNN